MGIDYENDLLKHFVRTDGWLPLCKRRLATIRANEPRRLKYFTFCAVGAVDVLMLDVAKVIRQSQNKRFDTVYFFDKDAAAVVETQRRIPGAIGFPGNFVEIVLLDDPDDVAVVEAENPLDAPPDELDEAVVHENQQKRSQKIEFIKAFPFDVINLDLEQFLYRPKEELPGRLIRAIENILQWQKRPRAAEVGGQRSIDGFSLMFTTQIGPPNLPAAFLDMLEHALNANLKSVAGLSDLLVRRAGTSDVTVIRGSDFDLFFKIAVPKELAGLLLKMDWYPDPRSGIRIYEFERPSSDGGYKMLHMVMDVNRQKPHERQRSPSIRATDEAIAAYEQVVRGIVETPELVVMEGELDIAQLRKSLDQIKARRRRYCPDCE